MPQCRGCPVVGMARTGTRVGGGSGVGGGVGGAGGGERGFSEGKLRKEITFET